MRRFSLEEAPVQRKVANQWCGRFRAHGVAGLVDAQGGGRPPPLSEEVKQRVITEATRPPKGRLRCSVRTMARHAGLSVGAVHGLWHANDIKPHLSWTFKVSNDPDFEPKFWDVIGLYLDPPQKALVLCCDEKSQCQAMERTQPGLPLGLGHIRTRTHASSGKSRHGKSSVKAKQAGSPLAESGKMPDLHASALARLTPPSQFHGTTRVQPGPFSCL